METAGDRLHRAGNGPRPVRAGSAWPLDSAPGLHAPEGWRFVHTVTIGRHARYEIRYVRIDVVPRRGPQSAGMVILSALERYAYLIHAYCRRRLGDDSSPALLPGPEPSGLA